MLSAFLNSKENKKEKKIKRKNRNILSPALMKPFTHTLSDSGEEDDENLNILHTRRKSKQHISKLCSLYLPFILSTKKNI